jgi:hypothetical protein
MNENVTEPKHESASDDVAKVLDAWSEFLKLPSIGPTYAFSKEFVSYANDFATLAKVISEMKSNMESYWTLINRAFMKAVRETAEKSPREYSTKEDFEAYRRVMIEAFENAYTELFGSTEFSEAYGKVFSSELDIRKAMQSIAEKNLRILNMPTRSEVDEILKDIHELKKSVRSLTKALEEKEVKEIARASPSQS